MKLSLAFMVAAFGAVAPLSWSASPATVPIPVANPIAPASADNLQYHLAACYPHDPKAFTQGLIYRAGELYESTGLVGQSTIRRVRIVDGRVLQSVSVDPPHFGEGMTNWKSDIISLTWRSGTAFRWDRKSLKLRRELRYEGEGWGLTQNGRNLILSDGTSQLRFLDPESFAVRQTLPVTVNGKPLAALNELEWVEGSILANVWQTSQIVRIDPQSGKVTGILDLRNLAAVAARDNPDAVLNGIAYDAQGRRLFVTGKTWPLVFELRPGKQSQDAKGCAQLPDAAIMGRVLSPVP